MSKSNIGTLWQPGPGTREMMCVEFAECLLMVAPQMQSIRVTTAQLCGECAHMPFTCSALTGGFPARRKGSRSVLSVVDPGSLKQPRLDKMTLDGSWKLA